MDNNLFVILGCCKKEMTVLHSDELPIPKPTTFTGKSDEDEVDIMEISTQSLDSNGAEVISIVSEDPQQIDKIR